MALRNRKEQTAPAAGGFEDEGGGTVVADKPTATPTPAATAAAAEMAGTAIAVAAKTGLAVSNKMPTILEDFRDAMPAVEFGVLPRIVGTNGLFMDGDKKQLGSKIKVQLVSWCDSYVISPGDDTDEAKAAVRYSKDGVIIDETGESVVEYLTYLRESEKYTDAKSKHYAEIVGIVLETEKPSDHVNCMVSVSLSPESRKLFEGYRLQQTVKIRLGLISPDGQDVLTLGTEVKTNARNQTFTLIKPLTK